MRTLNSIASRSSMSASVMVLASSADCAYWPMFPPQSTSVPACRLGLDQSTFETAFMFGQGQEDKEAGGEEEEEEDEDENEVEEGEDRGGCRWQGDLRRQERLGLLEEQQRRGPACRISATPCCSVWFRYLCAPMTSASASQSDVMYPSNPHSSLATVFSSQSFAGSPQGKALSQPRTHWKHKAKAVSYHKMARH